MAKDLVKYNRTEAIGRQIKGIGKKIVKKVPGQFYYHYVINNKEVLSIIEPEDWSSYSEYLGKYLYNYDELFYKIE